MSKKIGVYWITACLVFILVLGSVTSIADFNDSGLQFTKSVSAPEERGLLLAGTPHAPIIIDGDTNFTLTASNEGWDGDGSSGNPFIINGLDIDREDSAGHCISISNTRVNFTISNCNLAGASVDPGAGIYLDIVKNARVVDNFCQQNAHGVLVQGRGSENCILTNNTCTQNSVSGIQLVACLNISLIRNNCNSNYHGINAIDLINLNGRSGEHVLANNICCNNTYGISIGDFNMESIGPILNTVSNNNCSANSEDGIRLITPVISSFINNSCNGNGADGISFDEMGSQCMLVENTCNENGQSGIYLNGAWTNNFTDNFCSKNNQYGIYLKELVSGYNNFHWNAFSDNLVGNARDGGYDNIFDYNFWSDYSGVDVNGDGFGDTPYTFTTNSDPHPLMFQPIAPKWVETPVDQTIEYETHFVYDLNATASGQITWSVNWTVHLTIDSQGVIESDVYLSLGKYGVQVTVTNIYNVSISAKFTLEVVLALDTTAPSWVVIPMDLEIEYGEGVDIQIHALDRSDIDHWTLNDTTYFTLSATYYDLGSTARITNNSILEPSSYGLNITVYDPYDNYCSAIFVVTVLEVPVTTITTTTTTTVSTTTTTTTTTGSTPSGVDPVMTLILGAGIGGIAVIILVIVLIKKKS